MKWTPKLVAKARKLVDAVGWDGALAEMAAWCEDSEEAPTRASAQKAFERHGAKPGIGHKAMPSASEPEEAWTPSDGIERSKLKREITELARRQKALLEELEEARERQALLDFVRLVPTIRTPARRAGVDRTQRPATPVAVVSDLHVEEPVKPEKVDFKNEYNLEIAELCIQRIAEAVCWFADDKRFDMRSCVVAIIGDTYSGVIHEDLLESVQLLPMQVICWLLERLERMLRFIAANTKFERIVVPCADGNHGRNTPRMRIQTRTENSLEWLMYTQLAARLKDEPRIEFQIADGIYTHLQVHNTHIGFTHGDTFGGGGGLGGPVPGIRRKLAVDRQHRRIDHVVMGHFHSRQDYGDVVMNGSGIGVAPYGVANHFSPEQRQQTWFLVDAEHGKGLCAPIWLPQYDPKTRTTKG